jgi:hypothetical protein
MAWGKRLLRFENSRTLCRAPPTSAKTLSRSPDITGGALVAVPRSLSSASYRRRVRARPQDGRLHPHDMMQQARAYYDALLGETRVASVRCCPSCCSVTRWPWPLSRWREAHRRNIAMRCAHQVLINKVDADAGRCGSSATEAWFLRCILRTFRGVAARPARWAGVRRSGQVQRRIG